MEDREKLKEWKEKFLSYSKHIIVEGKNDKKALVTIGYNPELIIVYNAKGLGIVEFCEDIAKSCPDVVILTDFDDEGKKLYRQFVTNFERLGVKVDRVLREMLRRYSHISHIEGLDTYLRNLGL